MTKEKKSVTRILASALVDLASIFRVLDVSDLDQPTGQVGKLLGERWKALNEKQRAPYESKAAADKKRYEDEKANYDGNQVCLISREGAIESS